MAFAPQNKTIGSVVKNVGKGIFNRTLGRLFSSGIRTDSKIVRATAKWSGRASSVDWRVKLTIPQNSPLMEYFFNTAVKGNTAYDILGPLKEMGGIFWPLTPSMIIQHSANYNAMAFVHSNYPHQAYQNSQVDQMNIIGEFPVQNQQDARHWVATIHFLRAVTKMFFGKDPEFKGSPPPILHLSGYGDHMFNKVPVVVNTFNVELRAGIDYISTKQDSVYSQEFTGANPRNLKVDTLDPNTIDPTWAPTLSNISVLVTPLYSRESLRDFSMKDFVQGKLNGKGSNEVGFI